jgi:hypothetical protein
MLSAVTRPRFSPRSAETNAQARRYAALRAVVTDLTAHVEKLQKDQDTQLRRIAQVQQELDEIKHLVKKLAR